MVDRAHAFVYAPSGNSNEEKVKEGIHKDILTGEETLVDEKG